MGSHDYIKFYFIKYDYNSKDSHQDGVDPEEKELESSWAWLRQHTSLISFGKDMLQEEIDAFEEAPKALVKWVPKTTSSSTSLSTTTTPRIPINMVWIPKKKN